MAGREWHLVEGQQLIGVLPEPTLAVMAREGRLSNSVLLSCGQGWITVPQFLASLKMNGTPANGNGVAAPQMMPAAHQLSFPPPIAQMGRLPQAIPRGDISPPMGAPMAMPAPMMAPPPMAAPVPPMPAMQPPAMRFMPGAAPAEHSEPPPPMPQSAPSPALPAIEPIDDGPPERDRIVVLGRRQSGKTIYLASVYQKLWRSLQGLTAKALRGEVHKQLMEVSHVLKQGQWPAATLGSAHMELELEEAGQKRLMLALDYAGEMFANAFVHERLDLPDVKTLVDHIDRAAAVMLLIDPSIVAGMDQQAAMEDDFGLVQAVERIRNWPGGDDVPVVLVLTKIDQHQSLLDQSGGPDGFCRHHFPALVRLLRKVAIFQVSAVQVEKGADGKLLPRTDSTAMNVDNPLRYCLRQILRAEEKSTTDRAIQERRMLESRLRKEELSRERKQNLILIAAISAIIIAGIVIILLIVL